jgi:ferredoxin
MPKLTVEGSSTVEVADATRLVLAIERDAHVDIMHACGGFARCTTCRVEFIAGEPPRMTAAEKTVLATRGLQGVRLSCQILCDHDMSVRPVMRVSTSGRSEPGPTPEEAITPTAEWV